MTTDTGSMSAWIDRLSKTEDPKTILELSRQIREGARQVRIKLDDPNAAHYPFVYQKGAKVALKVGTSTEPESKGKIVDGLYEGTEAQHGWYTITYTIQRDKDGSCYEARI